MVPAMNWLPMFTRPSSVIDGRASFASSLVPSSPTYSALASAEMARAPGSGPTVLEKESWPVAGSMVAIRLPLLATDPGTLA